MGHIISLHGDPHDRIEMLLPWYVTGTLDAADAATVDTHLAACAACRAMLETERALAGQVAAMPIGLERDWAAMRARITPAANEDAVHTIRRPRWTPTARWVVGAQAAAILVLGVGLMPSKPVAAPTYHALGAAPVAGAGNIVVAFRPAMREQAMRDLLGAADARLVDGPTVTGAYVLRVPAAGRDAAVAMLRAHADVVMAEPIDAGGPP